MKNNQNRKNGRNAKIAKIGKTKSNGLGRYKDRIGSRKKNSEQLGPRSIDR